MPTIPVLCLFITTEGARGQKLMNEDSQVWPSTACPETLFE